MPQLPSVATSVYLPIELMQWQINFALILPWR